MCRLHISAIVLIFGHLIFVGVPSDENLVDENFYRRKFSDLQYNESATLDMFNAHCISTSSIWGVICNEPLIRSLHLG